MHGRISYSHWFMGLTGSLFVGSCWLVVHFPIYTGLIIAVATMCIGALTLLMRRFLALERRMSFGTFGGWISSLLLMIQVLSVYGVFLFLDSTFLRVGFAIASGVALVLGQWLLSRQPRREFVVWARLHWLFTVFCFTVALFDLASFLNWPIVAIVGLFTVVGVMLVVHIRSMERLVISLGLMESFIFLLFFPFINELKAFLLIVVIGCLMEWMDGASLGADVPHYRFSPTRFIILISSIIFWFVLLGTARWLP